MEHKNFSQEDAYQVLFPLLPQDVQILLQPKHIKLRHLTCIEPISHKNCSLNKRDKFYAWCVVYGDYISFTLPGKLVGYTAKKQNFAFKAIPTGASINITFRLDAAHEQTFVFQLIPNRHGTYMLIPEWWLDAQRVAACYFANPARVKHRLQQIRIGNETMLAWRLISTKPCSIHWFIIEDGRFTSSCDAQLRHLPNTLEIEGSTLRFK